MRAGQSVTTGYASKSLVNKPVAQTPRAVATLVMGFVLAVLSSTLFAWWAMGPVRLDPLIVMVVSAGFRLRFAWAAGLAFALGFMDDTLSGGILGLSITAFVLVVFCCSLAERKLQIRSYPLQMAAVGIMSLVAQAAVTGGLLLADRPHVFTAQLPGVILAQALLNAMTAPVFFAILEVLVRLFGAVWAKSKNGAA